MRMGAGDQNGYDLDASAAPSPAIWTTNFLERLFLEECRRTKIIPHTFGECPAVRPKCATSIRKLRADR